MTHGERVIVKMLGLEAASRLLMGMEFCAGIIGLVTHYFPPAEDGRQDTLSVRQVSRGVFAYYWLDASDRFGSGEVQRETAIKLLATDKPEIES